MSLILAVQPDAKQASQIVSLVRRTLGEEIIVADSAEQALQAMAEVIPDLVLVSQLLSPRDDAAITEHLRGLDADGLAIQTLVIPVLASRTRPPAADGGILSRLRGTRDRGSAPEGCDPAVFAAQIAEYLKDAHREDTRRQDSIQSRPDSSPDLGSTSQTASASQPTSDDSPSLSDENHTMATEAEDWTKIELPEEEDDCLTLTVEPVALIELPEEEDDDCLTLTGEPIDLEEFIRELNGPNTLPDEHRDEPSHSRTLSATEAPDWKPFFWPRLEGGMAVSAPPDVPALLSDPILAEFVEGLASLQSEAQLEGEAWTPLTLAPDRLWPRMETKTGGKTSGAAGRFALRPLQDQWGFFDPEQCGMYAVLERIKQDQERA